LNKSDYDENIIVALCCVYRVDAFCIKWFENGAARNGGNYIDLRMAQNRKKIDNGIDNLECTL
jgi:hypothetical protein